MITNKLLDEHEDVNYFVYLTNRPDALHKLTKMILNKDIKNDREQIKEWFFREYIN